MLLTVRRTWGVHDENAMYHVILGKYIAPFTEECDSENHIDDGEHSEETDEYYWPGGWYEINTFNPDFGFWKVEGDIVAFAPAPNPWKPTPIPAPTEPLIPEELIGCEDPDADGGYVYPCQSCGQDAPILCDPEEWSQEFHLCGRSPSCCP